MERVAGAQNDSHQTEQLELVAALAAADHQDTDGDDGYQIYRIKNSFYDCLLEMCVPISCIGVSFRKENAQEELERLKSLIG